MIPSVWEEVAPLVALEQMMQGALVIASDIGGLGEEVSGFGLKFPAGDFHALASCMRRVADEPEGCGIERNGPEACIRELHREPYGERASTSVQTAN